jgi:hypothetical protein
MKRYIWIVFAGFAACIPVPPPPSIPDEKMSRIMADIYIAEAATNGMAGANRDSVNYVYYSQVMEIHGITRDSYEKNIHLLSGDIPRMRRVMERAQEMVGDTSATK